MIVLGLTGCIAMGKSAASDMFRRLGIPVHDADGAVHRLLGRGGGAVGAVEAAFPGSIRDGAIDHETVAKWVFKDRQAFETVGRHPSPACEKGPTPFSANGGAARRHLGGSRCPLAVRNPAGTKSVMRSRWYRRP